jgi:hypothetical protein
MRNTVVGWMLSVLLAVMGAGPASAQNSGAWVQVEAHPTLREATDRARAYSGQFPDVAGFALRSGWYVVAMGPYSAADADTVLRRLRSQGLIPGDSYLADGSDYRQQFWPIGSAAAVTPQPLPEEGAEVKPTAPVAEAIAEPVAPLIAVPDETEREARASEELLSRPERELLQTALQWAGFYDSAIDGAYGRGTRNAMAAWQEANNHEVTGILTSGQRGELLAAYNAVLEGLGLNLVRDDATGIQMMIPTGVVAFAAYEPPFARFDASQDFPAQVLLISQEGDLNRLFGLYEIMQTLEIVPAAGPRERGDDSFVLEGIGPSFQSYTYAALEDGQIKGFTLVWPTGDDERRSRLLSEMQASFARIDGVLDPALSRPGEDQAVDLISGLEVRQPRLSRSGFYIDMAGTVLTTTEVVGDCEEITLDEVHPATVVTSDPALGIAVLRPTEALSPIGVAAFQTGVPRLQAEVAVAGYPYGGVLTRPAMTFGRLADIRGLNGEDTLKRLAIVTQPGDAGGPVFDNGGAVLGMLLPRAPLNGQVLPDEVSFAVDADAILGVLAGAGVAPLTTDSVTFVPPEALTRQAAAMTVLVSCW